MGSGGETAVLVIVVILALVGAGVGLYFGLRPTNGAGTTTGGPSTTTSAPAVIDPTLAAYYSSSSSTLTPWDSTATPDTLTTTPYMTQGGEVTMSTTLEAGGSSSSSSSTTTLSSGPKDTVQLRNVQSCSDHGQWIRGYQKDGAYFCLGNTDKDCIWNTGPWNMDDAHASNRTAQVNQAAPFSGIKCDSNAGWCGDVVRAFTTGVEACPVTITTTRR